jgi:hypothetical protein
VAELEATLAAILAEARAAVAAGRDPNAAGVRTRIATLARGAPNVQADALNKLEQIVAVHRAKARLEREAPRPAAPAPKRAPLLTKPTVTGTLGVRRGEGFRLAWDRDPKVAEWEVRLSERPDVRTDYVEHSVVLLPASETSIELPLGDLPFRVNVIGRGRGKVQRRALVSGLTREAWKSRWQRRPTAS